MKLIIVTTFFPHKCDPVRAVFIKCLADELANYFDIEVVSPLAYTPFFLINKGLRDCLNSLPKYEEYSGLRVHRPRYFVFPGFGFINGLTYAIGVYSTIKKLIIKL